VPVRQIRIIRFLGLSEQQPALQRCCSMSAPVASETRSPFSASSEISAC
jgi:hypothetical protein